MMAPPTHRHLLFALFFFLGLSGLPASAQTRAFEEMVFTGDSMNTVFPREKIFLHYDRPSYRPGDTIWFKGYLVTSPEHIPNDSSRLAYIEIINAQQEVVKRISTPCFFGLFAGNITLVEKNFPQGEYLLRAYTRYQENFGDSLFFESRFLVIDRRTTAWQTIIHTLRFNNNRLQLAARLMDENRLQLANRAITVRLRAKNKILFRTKILTDAAGNIGIDTLLSQTDRDQLQLEIAEQDQVKLQLPVKTGGRQSIDLQFLPEGGMLVTGLPQQLGFKALNAAGKGIEVKGTIQDSKGTVITSFASIHKGMGIVSFTPQPHEVYTAVLDDSSSFAIPAAQNSGMVLQVDASASDSIHLRIIGSADLYGNTFYFTVTTRGITAARGRVRLSANGFEARLARGQFRSGVTVFTLYDQQLQPVCGRAVFIHHPHDLQLALSPHKEAYDNKDSVSLRFTARNSRGEPGSGSFSIAVVDTGQVKISPDAENIISYLLLSTDVKGVIEEPGYYVKSPDPHAVEALMLTQGWISYHPTATPVVPYEKDFVISGRVSNILNKSLSAVNVLLFGKAGTGRIFIQDTITRADGTFAFSRFDFFETDSISLLLKAVNKKGKSFNVGIELDEPSYPAVPVLNRLATTDHLLTDTIAQQYIQQHQLIADLKKQDIVLEEVIVTSKLRIQGSKNLNEDGGADQVINEEILNKTPKESLLNILKTQVKGFYSGTPPKASQSYYMINSNIVRVIIDGVDLNFFYQPVTGMRNEYVQFLDTYLEYFAAEDIRAIEIMNTPTYNAAYRQRYLTIKEYMSSGPVTRDFSFIEITTRTGQGPFIKKTPGMYLLRPLYPVIGKQFYSPRYSTPAQPTVVPDLRQTVYWNPDVVTDVNGEAVLSFYTSESRSNYLVIVQGTDLKGNFGVLYQPLMVKSNAEK